MSEPRVLVREAEKKVVTLKADRDVAWLWIGWFGLVLAVVGLSDFALAWYPSRFGSPEWEFGTIASSYSGLPLLTMGLAAMLGSALARGVRWQVLAVAILLLVLGTLLVLGFVLFLTTVPVALRATEGVAALGIKKAVVKTTMLSVAFPGGYIAAGVVVLRQLRRMSTQAT